MIKTEQTLEGVKEFINSAIKKPAKITINLGRNKYVSFDGEIKSVYPALFTIEPLDLNFKGKTSYSYSELMCGRVKISLKQNQ